jgi:hypothetical protein
MPVGFRPAADGARRAGSVSEMPSGRTERNDSQLECSGNRRNQLRPLSVGNGLGAYHYFGEKGARQKQPGFGEVAPTLDKAGFFSRIRSTRGGLGPNMITVG